MNAETNAVEINEQADAVSAVISNMKMSPAKKDEMTVADATEDDELPDGYPYESERPCYRVYSNWWTDEDGKKCQPGAYLHTMKVGKKEDEPDLPIDTFVCSPVWVNATTRDAVDGSYGRLLEILSPTTGKIKRWSMPMQMLAGDGTEVLAVLLDAGVTYKPRNRSAVIEYVATQQATLTMRAAANTGWCGDAFVLPDTVIGANDVWFQAARHTAPYATTGTFDGWREMAALASGNPFLMLGIAASFAGPLLQPLNIEGGGLHLFSDSSTGKTTSLLAALSSWGSPEYRMTWRATSNGLEGAAVTHTDTLLPLDEIGECEPRALYESAYMLANGQGKQRAGRSGGARQAAQWRVFVLSTGEVTIAGRIASGGITAKAGQGVRILDVPVLAKYGMFDELHGREGGKELSIEIKSMAAAHYGHAGPAFVQKLIDAQKTGMDLNAMLGNIAKLFPAQSDQEARAARIFALCALAGKLAAQFGVTTWQADEPVAAALHSFKLWSGHRGPSASSSEHTNILRAVADFIDRHGSARFSNIAGCGDKISNQAGYFEIENDGGEERREYLFTSTGLREATKDYDFARVLLALDKAGAVLNLDSSKKKAKTVWVPDAKEAKRLYRINPAHLEDGS